HGLREILSSDCSPVGRVLSVWQGQWVRMLGTPLLTSPGSRTPSHHACHYTVCAAKPGVQFSNQQSSSQEDRDTVPSSAAVLQNPAFLSQSLRMTFQRPHPRMFQDSPAVFPRARESQSVYRGRPP